MGYKVLNIVDSLIAAGAERMAVNIANGLQSEELESFLCATHSGGPLEKFFLKKENFVILNKKSALDISAFFRLLKFIKSNNINVIHAHSSSIYWSLLLKIMRPKLILVWHDHFGYSDFLDKRKLYGTFLFEKLIDHVFAVNVKLKEYSIQIVGIKKEKVTYLSNFPDINLDDGGMKNIINSDKYPKYVCLANLRPQKDHMSLIEAFDIVKKTYPEAQLYLVGGDKKDEYLANVTNRIKNKGLGTSIHLLGSRDDVSNILKVCNVGVLSSISEGLPVSLLEYGLAGLSVVCTKVGECEDVLNNGSCGYLVEPKNIEGIADAMIKAVEETKGNKKMCLRFQQRVNELYSKDAAIKTITNTYKKALY